MDQPEGYFKATRHEMLEFLPADVSRILEIGCGSGSFGRLVKSTRNCAS